MRNVFLNVIGMVLLVGSLGCNSMPPSVASKADILKLPANQSIVSARFLSDDDIPALARLQELRHLDFSIGTAIGKAKVTDIGFIRLAKLKLPKLDSIMAALCDQVGDVSIEEISQLDTLTYLSFCGCPRVTDKGMNHIIKMKNLTGFDVRGCNGITDKGLETLATKKNWKTIYFGGCDNVTLASVQKLQKAFPDAVINKDNDEWKQSGK